jgi:RNA polymerase sigma-70 factor (ECF subfamily)
MPVPETELRELYVRYAPVLHHRARAILGSEEDAADAVQETFARVVRNWEQFRQEASPLTWMYQISTNWCLNQLRNRKGHQRKHTDHAGEIGGSPTAAVTGTLDADTLRTLLAEEDDETRRILVHLYFDDMTREETAKFVGISVPTLRKRHDAFLRRARRALGVAVLATMAAWLLLHAGTP